MTITAAIVSNNDSLKLFEFLKQFPRNEPLIMDVSNIQTFHSIQPLLQNFERTHPRMVWVIGSRIEPSVFYKNLVLDSSKAFHDTIQAKRYFAERNVN